MMKILKYIVLNAAIIAAFMLSGCQEQNVEKVDISDEAVAYALARRVMGPGADFITFVKTDIMQGGQVGDWFELRSEGPRIVIKGNNSNSMAVGLNHYLKYYCNVEVGWFKHDRYTIPTALPEVAEPVRMSARVPQRFFLNYCTYGYTMPWWGWSEWEHFIDWMALQGINLPLAITGQESIWYEVWSELGLSDEQIRSYFTGPAHLPWHRMQNIDRWQGPLPKGWLDGQKALQKKIVARERELRMRPVLPAFAGHVPAELAEIYPDAPIKKLSRWAGFSSDYACSFLDPTSELYAKIQKMFVTKEQEEYGTDHIYGIDIFNEVDPPSWEPDYLGSVSRQVYESLSAADSSAVWLQMGWMFYYDRKKWTNDRIESYLTAVPDESQMILDYYCDKTEVWRMTNSFFKEPFIWCYLGNFGGNTLLNGDIVTVNERIENTFAEGGSNFCGIGSTLEGLDCNPFVYEYVFEKAWTTSTGDVHRNPTAWISSLAMRRSGGAGDLAIPAWTELLDSVYSVPNLEQRACWITRRPDLEKNYTTVRYPYSNSALFDALQILSDADGSGSAYEFDLVNFARQWLCNHFTDTFELYRDAYRAKDRAAMGKLEKEMMIMLDDLDFLLATQPAFLLGKWIQEARAWGDDSAESDYFETNARNILTSWSDKGMPLNDYASRTWSGMVTSYYKVRYEMFFSAVSRAMDAGEEFDVNAYNASVTDFEGRWWEERLGVFQSAPVGNPKEMVKTILERYKP